MNSRGQVNIIAAVGMIAATIIAVMNMMNYINDIGLSSQIYITAQNSIFQVSNMRDYILQQAQYEFDKAQLIAGLTLAPSVECGYINGSKELPQLGIPIIYYWDTPSGQACLPYNSEIELSIMKLLNESQFAALSLNSTGLKEYININLTQSIKDPNLYIGSFTSPVFSGSYEIVYDSSSGDVSVKNQTTGNTIISGPILGTYFNVNNYSFLLGPIQSTVTGILNTPASTSAFFRGSMISPNSQYALVTLNNQQAIIYSNETNNVYSFHIAFLNNPYAYTLSQADGGVSYTLINNSVSNINGVQYKFLITSDTNGLFSLSPVSYATMSLQPDFVFMKYLVNSFPNASKQNLLFPNYQNLYVSLSVFPLYNPQVCVSSQYSGFSLENCLPLAGQVYSQNYLSTLLQLSDAFINQSFDIGQTNVTGFPQYLIYNYLENVIHGVNMKTVTVDGKPKYDWYSSLIMAIGSPQGINYTMNQISCAKVSEYGTYIYNCSITPSCLETCQRVLSNNLGYAIQNLLNYQAPSEVSFLSGQPFSINILNVSVNGTEAQYCGNNNVNYKYSYSPPKSDQPTSEEVLGVPISLIFGYRNHLSLYPTEGCGLASNPYVNCYPGFDTLLATGTQTFDCCSPIFASEFLNKTCVANLMTTDKSVASYINYSTGAQNHGICSFSSKQGGITYYYCDHFVFNESNTTFEPSGYLNQWILHSNACPSTITIDGELFTPSNGNYTVLNEYGGGAFSLPDEINEWSSAFINNLNLTNMSLNIVANISGAAPAMNIILSNNSITNVSKINQQTQVMQINVYDKNIEFYNYSDSVLKPIAFGKPNVQSGINQIQLNKNCLDSNCNVQLTMNTQNVLNFTFTGKNKTRSIGFATDILPSFDSIKFIFVSNYNKIKPFIMPYQPAYTLSSSLISDFGIASYLNLTAYNQITLSSRGHVNNPYQLNIIIDNNFDLNQLNINDIKIFGVYTNGNVEQLNWWNETPIGLGSSLWINLTNDIPNSVYIVYGPGTYYTSDPYADNASRVFPLFFSSGDPNTYNLFSYRYQPKSEYIRANVTIGENGLILNDSAPIQPYIYETNDSRFYEQFACVSKTSTTLVNVSYLYSTPALNMQNLYGFYNPLYPGLQIVGSEQIILPVTTVFKTNSLPSYYTSFLSVTYDNINKQTSGSSLEFVTPIGYYSYSASFSYCNTHTSPEYCYECVPLTGTAQAGGIYKLDFTACHQISQI